MDKITPTHKAMETILNTIKALEMQYQELAATLPPDSAQRKRKKGGYLLNPFTGEKKFYAYNK